VTVERLRSLLGYTLILFVCYVLSSNRKAIRWRPVLWGLGLQAAFGLIVLHPALSQLFFHGIDVAMRKLLDFAGAGISFVFQATHPHQVTHVQGGQTVTELFVGTISPVMKTFAFWVLPTIIFFSALVTLLYHLRIMQVVVGGIARAMVRMVGTSGAETLSATASIVLGQTEAPLFIKPFVPRLTQSELMTVMLSGFAHVSAGIIGVYASFLTGMPGVAGHLMIASIMATPASLALAKIMVPETEKSETAGVMRISVDRPDRNAIEATARGAVEGMTLVLNIVAVLIAFVALVAMLNALLGLAHLSLEQLLGWLLSPLAWAMGVRWAEARVVGRLIGEKLVLTELLAYSHLAPMAAPGGVLGVRSAVIAAYSLCGFANIASIGIQIGGIGGMAPDRRGDLARLGLRAMIGGQLVSSLSACIAGLMV
jgi:concentrative nucleoside transporter, CNT family